jgi:hypothetical protein
MKLVECLAAAAVLLAPAGAQAAVNLSLNFTGVASTGAGGSVFPYAQGYPDFTSFAGEPVSISMSIVGTPADPYVQSFSVNWSSQSYSEPFITSWSGTGYPNDPLYDSALGYMSTVNLNSAGGSIHVFPTFGFIAFTDASFDLNFSYAKGAPFSGSGSTSAFLTFVIDPNIGAYDASANVPFTLTSMTQSGSVPEPSTWLMLLLGSGALGLALRARRSRLASKAA